MATLRKIDAPIQYDPTYGSVIKIDAPITYDPVETMRVMTAPLSGPAPVPDLIDTGMIIGLEVVPAIVGGLVGSLGGPKGVIGVGAAGSALKLYVAKLPNQPWVSRGSWNGGTWGGNRTRWDSFSHRRKSTQEHWRSY